MENVEYNLTFLEALEVLNEGGAVKGNNFRNGYYLQFSKYDDFGKLQIVNANDFYKSEPFTITKSLFKQKFRSLTVMTMKELCK